MTTSSCDISSFGGAFHSSLNRKRVELDYEAFDNLATGQRVLVLGKDKGVDIGKIKRFSQAAGKFFADVEFRIAALKFLKMINVDRLEVIPFRHDISLSCRRNKAKKSLAL